ncbi:hypothetical protein QEH31_gp23 [Streptomyces phage Chymera]|uniref:Uncharacterized protein n=1 Tax=Streptomyces phage Chymera TaxID=1821728 RepID=A0A142K649_9CAUD|nr:hypothetical protein QEH31_gp23 [Streptomyces phage Chymera]AMS01582.1 hypothetical protein SEA_CHYMERA_23 [Streptomyces phage Chymera]
MSPAAPPLDPPGVVEEGLRVGEPRAAEELNHMVVTVSEAVDLVSYRHPAAAGWARPVHDYRRIAHVLRLHQFPAGRTPGPCLRYSPFRPPTEGRSVGRLRPHRAPGRPARPP